MIPWAVGTRTRWPCRQRWGEGSQPGSQKSKAFSKIWHSGNIYLKECERKWFGAHKHQFYLFTCRKWVQRRRPQLWWGGSVVLHSNPNTFVLTTKLVMAFCLSLFNTFMQLLQCVFFNCSYQFSVPKWKTTGSQSEILFHEILDVQKIIVGWTTFFLALKFAWNS